MACLEIATSSRALTKTSRKMVGAGRGPALIDELRIVHFWRNVWKRANAGLFKMCCESSEILHVKYQENLSFNFVIFAPGSIATLILVHPPHFLSSLGGSMIARRCDLLTTVWEQTLA
ncbi:uncharacterized protein PHALS_03110 [Plasmopara halstedii]|uniref:Uncharacterized protein n=1 Tax=Plasmopara halstedii TaxID=4781 RepID=A0A0P1A891_PLAHL|nr:uncharacterized protein PHALS_03110 [Plasmopara halstedii]CEG36562.1 hypothetical protein PHALS_03110 [Plasmopara halstedii]|eukprot:XP_024572931.1 hypothetical protein PHALS_03110 [Plasmopara halstedii]